jgi:Family of unknown function (DUF6174)
MRAPRSLCLRPMLLALLVAGCTVSDGPLSPNEVRELSRARQRWSTSAARPSYRYEVRQACFCPVEITRWNTVTVRDGAVVGVLDDNGVAVPSTQWRSFPTVDEQFARLELTESDFLEDITVRFDPQDGYPLEMNFIYGNQIADAGGAIYSRNLRPVP